MWVTKSDFVGACTDTPVQMQTQTQAFGGGEFFFNLFLWSVCDALESASGRMDHVCEFVRSVSIAEPSRNISAWYPWRQMQTNDSGRYYAAGLPDVDLTAFARNVVNAWLALGVLFVLVCLKRCLYLVGCCVEGLDLYLAEDALMSV